MVRCAGRGMQECVSETPPGDILACINPVRFFRRDCLAGHWVPRMVKQADEELHGEQFRISSSQAVVQARVPVRWQ
jgi:hypothetical protein